MEIWKDVVGSNGEYMVSSMGKVMTTKTHRILKPCIDERGYERVCLFKVDRRRRFKVHRLVAAAFIPNPHDKPQVNHIDGNKRNNSIENLEWVTNEENFVHSVESGLRENHKAFCERTKKRIIATSIEDGSQMVFDSILSAGRALKTCHIPDVIKGKRKQAKGYTFRLEGGDAN